VDLVKRTLRLLETEEEEKQEEPEEE